MNKVSIFLKIIHIVKNWYLVFFVYFGIYRKKFFTLYLKNGYKIKLRTRSTDLQAFANVWALKEYEIKGFEIMNNDIIIDIGGHIGLFVLFASSRCSNLKIISVEPHPQNFLLLKENILDNNLHKTIVLNKAITNTNQNVELFEDPLDNSAHSIYGDGKNSILIEGITLEKILKDNQIEKCDMLKMDCEGAEFEIMESLSNDELLKINKLCLEYHLKNNNLSNLDILKNRLEKIGYKVNIKPTNNYIGMLYARK